MTTEGINPFYEKLFTFARNYALRWNLTKSLGFNYTAAANAVIDEPEEFVQGDITTKQERRFIWDQIANLGRMKNFNQTINANYSLPVDKIPFTDWISSDIRYSVGYDWVAGSQNQSDGVTQVPDSLFFGHFVSNQRDRGFNVRLDMTRLYDKATFLKNANTPKSADEKTSVGGGFLKFITMLKTVNGAYNIRGTTALAGFRQRSYLFGLDSSFNAPGLKFIFGDQDPNIRFRAAENGWLVKNQNLNSPFQQTFETDLDIRTDLEPTKDVHIQLNWIRDITNNYQEIFRFNETVGFETLTPSRSGSYSVSFLSIQTAFEKERDDNFSSAFNNFEQNLVTVHERLNRLNTSGQYNKLSQDVLIPAFIAAYSGKSPNEVNLTPFPKTPLPNWRINYSGLTNLTALQELFASITLSSGYASTYSVSGFTNSLNYGTDVIGLQNNLLDYPLAEDDATGKLIPVYIVNQVLISEQFVPLVGINLRTVSNISTKLELKKSRNLALNMSNAQVTETTNNDITLDFGYSKVGFKLPWRFQGRVITLKNDLTIRLAASVHNSKTIQRKINDKSIITNGNRRFQLRPSLTYKLNDTLDLTMYFERNVTNPKIQSQFRRATSAFGVQLRFSLAQ